MSSIKIAIIGLGYVGLPLARLFATKYPVIGYDVNKQRINDLYQGIDYTKEVEPNSLKEGLKNNNDDETGLFLTNTINEITACNIYIITVPTPVDKNKSPNLKSLKLASEMIGRILKKEDIVIYESTVYPGLTEDICVPILEKESKLIYNSDFFVGYSPERINPGDKEHSLKKILKVTSGSTKKSAKKVDDLYKSVIEAGTYLAPSIKVAEAAKVIENSQRDINIAFVNELAKIFNLMGIDTQEVLAAAATKWNFLPFKPGLVGGHCIGVDPYYLAQKAQEIGYHPEIILAGRKINDSMGNYVASEVVKLMLSKNLPVKGCRALILGITFKENCPDVRNTKVIDLIQQLSEYGVHIDVYDPWANPEEIKKEFNISPLFSLTDKNYNAIILAVAHNEFLKLELDDFLVENGVIYDIKGVLKRTVTGRL